MGFDVVHLVAEEDAAPTHPCPRTNEIFFGVRDRGGSKAEASIGIPCVGGEDRPAMGGRGRVGVLPPCVGRAQLLLHSSY